MSPVLCASLFCCLLSKTSFLEVKATNDEKNEGSEVSVQALSATEKELIRCLAIVSNHDTGKMM